MELRIWRDLRVQLPAEWEMLQFSRDPARGRCAFADRHDFRFELNWRIVEGQPDFKRMMDDYAAKLKEMGSAVIGRVNRGPWRGIECDPGGRLTTRFGRYFDRTKRLVELVFLWPAERDTRLERSVLESVSEEPLHEPGLRRWRSFGMDLLTPGGLALQACAVEPAHVEMVFSDAKERFEERFARRGMVTAWLDNRVEEWLSGWLPTDVSVAGRTSMGVSGHRIEGITGERKSPGIVGGLHKRSVEAVAWTCPEDGRLYSAIQSRPISSTDEPIPQLRARLSCCSKMGLAS